MIFRSVIIFLIFQLTAAVCFSQKDSLNTTPKKKWTQTAAFKASVVPTTLITLGLLSMPSLRYDVRDLRNRHFTADYRTHADDYIQYVPIAVPYLLGMVTETKSDFINKTLLLAKSEILMSAVVTSMKNITHVERPGNGNYLSFPSGHTGMAFVAATFMHKELGEKSVLYSIAAYSMATSVGVLRIANDVHWVSDILVGAGIGILSTNIVYATHKYRWGKNKDLSFMPVYSKNFSGVYLAYSF